MKRKLSLMLALCFAFLIGIISIAIFYCKHTSYGIIREGVSLDEAMQIVDNNDHFFIVTSQHGATGAQFAISYGESNGADVELSKNTPMTTLSNVFFLSLSNSFLIKSTGYCENVENLGKPFHEAYPNVFTIEVESWEIITPIRRDYQYRKFEQRKRFFSPRKYIDQFDVDNEDYKLQ